jgi:hypothetical protein
MPAHFVKIVCMDRPENEVFTTYENNTKKYDQEYDKKYDFWGLDLGPEPQNIIQI